ncbi:MAG TPA: metallophosphoesterase [Myxococcales bacterium]
MRSIRFLIPLLLLVCVQAGLYLSIREVFLPRPDQARARVRLILAQLLAAAFFVSFLFASRQGFALPAPLRRFVVEPLLALETISVPLMLLLGLGISVAHRFPARRREETKSSAGFAGALPQPRRLVLARAATGLVGIAAAAAAAGIAEAELDPVLSRHDIPIRGLHPDLDGVTIVQLSDIHAGTLMTFERMRRIARAAAALTPDLVFFTGDLLDVSAKAAAPFANAFRDLHGRLGTFAVFGNHDYFAGAQVASRAIHDAGATLLRNSGARVQRGSGSLFLGGLDDPSRGSLGIDAQRALKAAAPEEPRIVLAHRPSLFDLCARQGAQLVLSGHTHGGQFALSPRWSLARALGPRTMGLYRSGAATLYVHRGMGTVGPVPMRLGSPPEIAFFTLRRV